jgi:hypothetical protein
MDETASYCTASPERNTVYTPVNRNIDECYTQVMGQYPLVLNDGSPFQYDDEASLDHHMRQMAAFNFQAAKFGYDMSQLQSPMAKPFEPPSYKGIYTFEWPANKAQPIQGVDDSWAASTRFLKLTNNGPPASTAALYGYLHDLGDIQDFNTTRLKTEGVFLVSFFDLRSAVSAFTKVKTEQQHWNIQYCSQAYYMVCLFISCINFFLSQSALGYLTNQYFSCSVTTTTFRTPSWRKLFVPFFLVPDDLTYLLFCTGLCKILAPSGSLPLLGTWDLELS